jgi:flagellar biosynthesis protein FliR
MIEGLILATVLVLFRVAAFVAFLPPMAGRGMPHTVRVGLALAITVLLAPQYAPGASVLLNGQQSSAVLWAQLAFHATRETMLGAGMAWVFGLCLVPVRVAGAWVAQEMGLTLGGLASPLDQQPASVITQLMEALGVLLFFALNLHHILFWSLGRSFAVHRVGGAFFLPSWDAIVSTVTAAIDQGFLVIAPLIMLLIVSSITLLVTMKTAPHFNFMSYGMTMRLVAGVVGMFLFFPEIFGALQTSLNRLHHSPVF